MATPKSSSKSKPSAKAAPKKKETKVKDIAERYKLTIKQVISELANEGIEIESATSVIDADMLDLIVDFFNTKFNPKKSQPETADTEANASDAPDESKEVHIKPPIVVRALAEALDKKPNEVIQTMYKLNVVARLNQTIDTETAIKVAKAYDRELVIDRRTKDNFDLNVPEVNPYDNPADFVPRPPVVTFLGHVDHGKTSLQDRARKTHVVSGEFGGITQHIGASTISFKGQTITFIDTPGHAAFTAMRARGANCTDIAILVVAATEGFMPQTLEALSHARAAKVPIIVAANKIDLPQADTGRILREMQTHGIPPEEWGGEFAMVPVSALTGEGMDALLERVLLEAEVLELKANPKRPAFGVVLEAQLEQGLGSTASVLVQGGTLSVGDAVLCGSCSGKIRSLIDDKGKRVKSAGPSVPVKVIGLDGVPSAGEKFTVEKNEKIAREKASDQTSMDRQASLNVKRGNSLEALFSQMQNEQKKTLNIVLKTDVRGSGEAISESLMRLPSEKIAVDIIHTGVGGINENDVLLAAASNAIIAGFNVRVNNGINTLAKQKGVEIRLYSVIYKLLEDIEEALIGKLAPEKREIQQGTGHILKIFEVTKGLPICGTMVDNGFVRVGSKVRVYRKKELIFNGEVRSLRRFQDDVKEVRAGLECGIRLDNFKDLEELDELQFYEYKSEKATL